jgi:NitT/TauT family transport system ATP-binding protein
MSDTDADGTRLDEVVPADVTDGCRVSLETVSVVHGSGPTAVVAVDGVSLEILPREFLCLIGPSGCGKTTLLKAMSGLLPERSVQGRLRIDGLTPNEARRNNWFAFVFQDPVLAPWRTVEANVKLPIEVVRNSRLTMNARSPKELIGLVGLQGFERALPHQLSGGMRQRVAIARALTLRPRLLLMDEPFGSLDELTRNRMQEELLDVWSTTNASVVLVTHSISEAVYLADRVVVMSARPGRVTTIVDIPFARPRSAHLKTTSEFLKYTNEVRDALGQPQ